MSTFKKKTTMPKELLLNQNPQITIAVCGTGGVGKSALTLQFVKGIYNDYFNPTIEESYTKTFQDGDVTYEINIIDTAGQEEYKTLRPIYIRESDALIVVYDITSKDSFNEIEEFIQEIYDVKDFFPPICLVGNKCDLKNRNVPTEEGKRRAEKSKFGFFETSAKEGINIIEPFISLAKQVVKDKKEKEKKSLGNNSSGNSGIFYKSFSKDSIEDTEFKIK